MHDRLTTIDQQRGHRQAYVMNEFGMAVKDLDDEHYELINTIRQSWRPRCTTCSR
jgi:hypothetical protein